VNEHDKMKTDGKREQKDKFWMDARERAHLTHFGRRASVRERSREQAMRDWYGPGEAGAVISSRRSPARHIAGTVDDVVRDLGLARDLLLEELVQNWVDVVGPDVARRSVPSEIQGKLLVVEVADSSWMFILKAQHRPHIISRLADFTGSRIRDVRFVPQGRIRRK